jgi:hypothetical protein
VTQKKFHFYHYTKLDTELELTPASKLLLVSANLPSCVVQILYQSLDFPHFDVFLVRIELRGRLLLCLSTAFHVNALIINNTNTR